MTNVETSCDGRLMTGFKVSVPAGYPKMAATYYFGVKLLESSS